MRGFFDTSALVKRYVDEPGSGRVEQLCRDVDAFAVSMLCVPEAVSALCRLRRSGHLSETDYRVAKSEFLADLADADVVDVTEHVVGLSVDLLEKHSLRAADSIHVASAVAWDAERFVSADSRQIEAAGAAGLATIEV